MQAFIEEQLGLFRQRPPIRESARFAAVKLGLVEIVHVMARLCPAGLAIGAEHGLELLEQVGGGPEMAEMVIAACAFLLHDLAHFFAVVTMEGIALDEGGGDLLAPEDLLECALHRSGAGAGRASDGNDRMFGRHGVSPKSGSVHGARTRENARPRIADLYDSA